MAPLADYLPLAIGAHKDTVVVVGIIIAAIALYWMLPLGRFPKNLPLVGESAGRQSFSFKTRWRYYTDCAGLYQEAYEKFSDRGKTVLVPGIGVRTEVVLPSDSISWLVAQPDDALNLAESVVDMSQSLYSLGHTRYWGDGWQFNMVKSQLSSVLGALVIGLNEELGYAFDKYLGDDTEEWKQIDLHATIKKVVAAAASRFTVGLPLCRNEEYLETLDRIIDGMLLNSAMTSAAPRWLRPVVGPLASWHTVRNVEKLRELLEPVYRERLETLKVPKNDPSHHEPQDQLQIMMRYAAKERPHELHDLGIITRRLCAVHFVSIQQTAVTVTNMLLDIVGSSSEFNTINVLRDEMRHVVGGGNPVWTKSMISQMVKTDSVARETMRIHPFANRSMFREVLKDDIVTTDGIKLPKGFAVSVLSKPVQSSVQQHDDLNKYDPFRFSRKRETSTAQTDGKLGPDSLSFASTSPEYIPFGHGRHACPGRFLIDFELKMIVAYLLLNYDIEFPEEYEGKRPANIWLAEFTTPPPGAKIKVKRRNAT